MTEGKKEKKKERSKAWLDFIVSIKLSTTTERWGRGEGERGKKEKPQRIYRRNRNIRIINAFLESLLSESFPSLGVTGVRHLPRVSSHAVLISGPAVRAAQILICSYSSVFLPPMSTALFSLAGALSDLFYIPQTQSLPS